MADSYLNGRDLRKAVVKHFSDIFEYDEIVFTVSTRRTRSYELPYLEVYITHAPNYLVYEQVSRFVKDWYNANKDRLKVRAPRQYYVSHGIKFPWPISMNRYESISGVEIILGAFAL